jgi:polysaccharide export outer membrane protein
VFGGAAGWWTAAAVAFVLLGAAPAGAGQKAQSPPVDAASELGADYLIGPGDVLTVNFWRRADVSSDVTVRPDGKISLLLLDDVDAAGLTPEQLRDKIVEKAAKYFEDARVTVIVKEVNSRNVYITGMVAKPGPYALRHRLTVMQLIALAGGLREFANGNRIAIMRVVNGKETGFQFNYDDARDLKHLEKNIELKPGDTVVVP